jgi:hypothetical protein
MKAIKYVKSTNIETGEETNEVISVDENGIYFSTPRDVWDAANTK